jgi:hypothetical protein
LGPEQYAFFDDSGNVGTAYDLAAVVRDAGFARVAKQPSKHECEHFVSFQQQPLMEGFQQTGSRRALSKRRVL